VIKLRYKKALAFGAAGLGDIRELIEAARFLAASAVNCELSPAAFSTNEHGLRESRNENDSPSLAKPTG